MAFGTQSRRGFADGGTVDVTISGAPSAPTSFIGANSSIPAQTAAQIAKYPTLPPATATAQPGFTPQPFSSYAAQVPVGGTSGAPTSSALGQIGANGIPIGSPGVPTLGAQSSLAPPVPIAPAAPAPAAAAAAPVNPTSGATSTFLGSNTPIFAGNNIPINNGALKRGGTASPPKLAGGGIPTSEAMDPWYTRSEQRGMTMQPQGLVKSTGAGRTDVHPINVPAGAYVLPADVVSGLGEGNTMAGSSVIDRMMNSLPFGIQAKKIGHGPGGPHAPAGPPLSEEHPYGLTEGLPVGESHARGGKSKQKKDTPQGGVVPIIVAGGEHILYPQTIIQKFGSLAKGHAVLDKFVLGARKQTIGDMRKLKGPKK